MSEDAVIKAVVGSSMTELDKAIVVLSVMSGPGNGMTAGSVATVLEKAGSPRINRSRLGERLLADRRTVRDGAGFRISPRKSDEVAELSAPFCGPTRPQDSSSVLDAGLFDHAHNYVKNLSHQINVSYDYACFDCAAVMIRRLFETLVVDSFEKQGAITDIKDANGEILSLSGLISRLSSTTAFTVSRQTKQAASHLKDVGDWSAHNRRHRARKSDIDAATRHLRLAASDLLHLAGQDGPPN